MRNICPTLALKVHAVASTAVSALAVLLLALAAPASWALALAQAQPAPGAAPSAIRPAAVKLTQAASTAKAPAEATKPGWAALTGPQQQALAPLKGTWDTIREAQKRKWLALSQNYPKLPAAEQAVMHSRMTEWVALSPQQRTQARFNFAETKKLAPDDKKAKWEAYQALPPEEKRKLAADAPAKTPGTTAAVKPVPAQKLATVPKPSRDAKAPRIAAGSQSDAGFPLPLPGPAGAPAALQPH